MRLKIKMKKINGLKELNHHHRKHCQINEM